MPSKPTAQQNPRRRGGRAKTPLTVLGTELLHRLAANPEFRARVAALPADVLRWASKRRAERGTVIEVRTRPEVGNSKTRWPFGHAALVRRLHTLQGVADKLFAGAPPADADTQQRLQSAFGDIDRKLRVAGAIPASKRRRTLPQIEADLDAVEDALLALVDLGQRTALLPDRDELSES